MALLFYVGTQKSYQSQISTLLSNHRYIFIRAVDEVDFRGFEDNFSNFSMETYVVIPH